MKTTHPLRVLASVSLLTALCGSARAGSITNNFDTTRDYVANGIMGDPNWDGVYLAFGDIRGGDPGGSGNGATTEAEANAFGPVLSITSTRGDWSAPGDDGFFLWKLVSGDFDVSVESVPTWATTANNFAGLLVRAYHTNNSGAPYSTTVANGGENWVSLLRGQEFNIDETRLATNGGNIELTFSDPIAGIAETRFFRIVRAQGTNFSFFWKVNATDPWIQRTNGTFYPNGVYQRGDLAGVSLQVGICEALFSGNSAQDFFTDFELTGSNVNPPPAMPPAPSNITFTPVNSNSVAISWTTNGGDGSLVVIRANGILQGNPVQGQTYTGDTNFQSTNTFLSVDRSHIVYSGTGTNITVTGLGGSNNTYYAYVFSSSGSGPAIAYNTASPASNSTAGPGIVSAVSFTVNPLSIPIGGAGVATIIATYNSGDSYDVSSAPNALTSSDPTIISINNGVMSALTVGTVQIVATYAGLSATNTVSTHTPVFTDNFGTTHDYVASGLVGSTWDGLFLNFGDVPGAGKGNDNVAGATSQFIANTNVLTIEAAGSTWAVAGSDGPYLFKILTGDFQASVHIGVMSTINNCDAGIMARLFNPANAGGGGAGGTETHINWVKVQNGTPAVRRTIDSGGTTIVNGLNATDGWLLMVRVNSTNFLFFEKANPGDPWSAVPAATMTVPEAANNAPMEVGLEQEMRTGSDGFAPLDTLMIDGPGIVSPTGVQSPPPATNFSMTLNGNLSMTLTWVAASNGVPVQSMVVMRAGKPVSAQPPYGFLFSGNSAFGSGSDLGGGNYVVFRSANPPASISNTVTVTGLSPGVIYYSAVYTFVGSGGTKVFDEVVPTTGASANLQDGSLQSISTLPVPGIPLGGLQVLQVIGIFQGGAQVNVSAFANITIGNPAIIVTTNGALTGLSVGTTTVTAVYGGFTNTVNATVRPPGFTDNFAVNQDYLANRTTGSAWDGVYLANGDVPETTFAGTGQTLGADANIGLPGVLSVTNQNGQWENDGNDGFFLFKYVPGDFQAAVHITDYQIIGYTFPGLGARGYSYGTNGVDAGAPMDLNFVGGGGANGENWVSFTRFDEFGIGTYARENLDNAVLQSTQPNPNNGDNWILIIRDHGTNFNFYERATNTAPWGLTPLQTSYAIPQFAGQPMQVGIEYAQYTGTPAYGHFDSFMLDRAAATIQVSRSGGNVLLSWPDVPDLVLQSTPSLSPPVIWTAVPGTPTFNGGIATLSLSPSGGARFFRLGR
jgi:hypothetical protein